MEVEATPQLWAGGQTPADKRARTLEIVAIPQLWVGSQTPPDKRARTLEIVAIPRLWARSLQTPGDERGQHADLCRGRERQAGHVAERTKRGEPHQRRTDRDGHRPPGQVNAGAETTEQGK